MAGIERILGKPDKAPATAELTEPGPLHPLLYNLCIIIKTVPQSYHIRNPLSNQQEYKRIEQFIDNRLTCVTCPVVRVRRAL